MYYLDTETCGFHGPVILIQYITESEPVIWNAWEHCVEDTMDLIRDVCDKGIVGFNLAFDWFHLTQLYTTLSLLDPDDWPEPELYARAEYRARDLNICLKPRHCFDLMLHARKGPYQSTMNRDDIRIKKVPSVLAPYLAEELGARIPLPDIYFKKKQNKSIRWQVVDRDEPEFKDIVLRFAPSSALKALVIDTGLREADKRLRFIDIGLPDKAKPKELGYAPFALAYVKQQMDIARANHGLGEISYEEILKRDRIDWHNAWPDKIGAHIEHWTLDKYAIEYARDDAIDTKNLYYFFSALELGYSKTDAVEIAKAGDLRDDQLLTPDDNDSVLACMVGTTRWHGFQIDAEAMRKIKEDAINRANEVKRIVNFSSTQKALAYLHEVLSQEEKEIVTGTGKEILRSLMRKTIDDICDECNGSGCEKCDYCGLVPGDTPHPVAERAALIQRGRKAVKEIEIFDKLILADRFHSSFVIIGAKSDRMSGSDGLNPQGINRREDIRKCFVFKWPGYQLDGGDFDAFEVSLMDAAYGDPLLRLDLMSGKKIHALFGECLFPPKTYEDIMATKGKDGDEDLYTRSKDGVFALAYGGESFTLQTRVGVTAEAADEAFQRWVKKYIVWGKNRQEYANRFCSMKQEGGIGTRVTWADPDDYIESMFGFRRYFTLENQICKVLFNLAEKPPKEWLQFKICVVRRDREQTASGAVRSALFAAAFALQAANMRAAGNHVIQSSGAQITKHTQRRIWDHQPFGVNEYLVMTINIHDEVEAVTRPEISDAVAATVNETVESYRKKVPLIGISWKQNMESWGEK